MDSDIIGFVVAIVLSVVIGLFERSGKKKKETAERTVRPSRRTAPRRVMSETTSAAPPEQPVQKASFLQSEEGVRVSKDVCEPAFATEQSQPAALRPLDADSLRNAVIWGEILQRKF